MINQSADYALRAVLFLAQRDDGGSCSASKIAAGIGVPRNYLGKVLHALTYARVLRSVRGPRGGFRLAVRPEALTLADVVAPFQRLPERAMCLLGDRACDVTAPCVAHRRWQAMADQVTGFFRTTTISAMLSGNAAVQANGAVSTVIATAVAVRD